MKDIRAKFSFERLSHGINVVKLNATEKDVQDAVQFGLMTDRICRKTRNTYVWTDDFISEVSTAYRKIEEALSPLDMLKRLAQHVFDFTIGLDPCEFTVLLSSYREPCHDDTLAITMRAFDEKFIEQSCLLKFTPNFIRMHPDQNKLRLIEQLALLPRH